MKKQFASLARRVSALFVALTMALLMATAAFAAEANAAVQEDTNGVIQVRVAYYDDLGKRDERISIWGSGFLINDSTVVTSAHVVVQDDDTLNFWAEVEGVDVRTLKDRLRIEIVVMNDLTIQASILNASSEMDFAILKLGQQIYDRHYLSIRDSGEVSATENVFALGFPGEVADTQVFNTFTNDDVTISAGNVSKMNQINNVNVIMTSAKITSGASGGPLVDANGNVIGINMGSTGDSLVIGGTSVMLDNNYFYHVASSQLIKALNALGIEYTSANGAAPLPTAEPDNNTDPEPTAEPAPAPVVDKAALSNKITEVNALELKDYTEDSVKALNDALNKAVTVNSNTNATQADVDDAYQNLTSAVDALEAKSGIPMWLIIAIAAAAVLVIIIIIIVVVMKKKGNKNEVIGGDPYATAAATPAAPMGGGFNQASPTPVPPQPVPQPPRTAGETTVLSQGAGETTVLNQGSSETTVLNQNFGSLTRVRTKETVKISKAEFVIGRERSRVDYCISDNTNVGRAHAKILNRGGAAYLVDMNATNGTFLNSVKVSGTQVALKNGDKITLADEDFTFSM